MYGGLVCLFVRSVGRSSSAVLKMTREGRMKNLTECAEKKGLVGMGQRRLNGLDLVCWTLS